MKKILTRSGFQILFLCFFSPLIAQDYIFDMKQILEHFQMENIREALRNKAYYEADGTPYLYEEGAQEGEIKIKGRGIYRGYLRYDMYADQVQFLVNGRYHYIGNPEIIEYITIGDYTLVYALTKPKKAKGGYFELVQDGDCRLLAKKEADLLPAVPAKAYSDPKPASFSHKKDKFYMQLGTNSVPQRISNKKSVLQLLSGKEPELEQYFENENPSVSNRDDLVKLIDYYNSL